MEETSFVEELAMYARELAILGIAVAIMLACGIGALLLIGRIFF